jgi:hypothetical protein
VTVTKRARFVLVVLAAAASASCRSGSAGSADAGRTSAAARPPRPRVVAQGEAPVDVERSKLSLAVIKDRDVTSPVVATVRLLDGALSLGTTPASARLSVNLDSFDSTIPLRNERVRGIFFETSAIGWETAELTVPSIPDDAVSALRARRPLAHVTLEGKLRVHGRTAPVSLVVDAGYADDGGLWVKTAAPAQVKISDLGLTDNLHRLSAICMHDSIDDVVTVTADLQFAAR